MGCGGSRLSNEELAQAAVNPPLPKGHAILESLFGALEAEYARNEGPKVGDWLEKLPEFGRGGEAELRPHGISVGEFESWVEKVEEAKGSSKAGEGRESREIQAGIHEQIQCL